MNRSNAIGYETKDVGSNLTGARITMSTRAHIEQTLEEAEHLAIRINRIVGALCGHMPENCEASSQPEPQGVLPGLEQVASRAARRIHDAHEELHRLEARFE